MAGLCLGPQRLAENLLPGARLGQLLQHVGFGKIFLQGQSAFNSEGEHLDIILDLIRSGEIKPGKAALARAVSEC